MQVAGLAALVACQGDPSTGPSGLPPTDGLRAEALSIRMVRVTWPRVTGAASYTLLRRVDLQGEFQPIIEQLVAGTGDSVVFLDESVSADHYYGYRVVSVDQLSIRSAPSTAWGVRMPPAPGIQLSMNTVAEAQAPATYTLVVKDSATDSVRASVVLPNDGQRRISPLPNGAYRVVVQGVPSWCSVPDSIARVRVRDDVIATITNVRFELSCRDPGRGRVVVMATPTGASVDTSFRLVLSGVVRRTGAPDTAVIISRTVSARAGVAGTVLFDRLLPGTYTVAFEDIASNCTAATRAATVTVAALSQDTVRFAAACTRTSTTAGRPVVVRSTFSPDTATGTTTVDLALSLDLTRVPTRSVGAIEVQVRYNPAVLTYVRYVRGQLLASANGGLASGLVLLAGVADPSEGTLRGGTVSLGTLRFTVPAGAAIGANTETETKVVLFVDSAGVATDTATIGSVESVFKVIAAPSSGGGTGGTGTGGTGGTGTGGTGTGGSGTGGSGTGSVALTAVANGPYAATVGSPVSFSAAGSTAGASYAWEFGDGTTGSGFAPSKSYAAAGTYTVRLTVSQSGSSASATSIVIVSTPGSGGTGGSGSGGSGSGSGSGTGGSGGTGAAFQITHGFSGVDGGGFVTLLISMELPRATPDTSVLGDWVISSLQWDPAVLEFVSFNFGQWSTNADISGSDINRGLLSIRATAGSPNNVGSITLARIRFRPVGASGSTTTTRTTVSNVRAATSVGGASYLSRIRVQEGTFTLP